MYRDLVSQLAEHHRFFPCCERSEIESAEKVIGTTFPSELKDLLEKTNGIEGDQYGLGLVWPIERILKENKFFRENEDFKELYMPFECLLFFGDAGNGDQFAYAIKQECIRGTDIYCWNHEDDSRVWSASNMKMYLEWWYQGKIKV